MSEKLLYVGLDHDTLSDNLDLAHTLAESGVEGNFGFKLNQDHAIIGGENYISAMVAIGKPVFVDLKMNNGSRTMANTARWLGDLGVKHTNVWAHAESNLAKTMQELQNVPNRPAILGVTFYTRWKEEYARKHHNMGLAELIRHWSEVVVDSRADGIILPGTMLEAVRDLKVTKLNPAVRIEGETTKSVQEQVSEPFDAIMAGSDILVVGSPIWGAPEPVSALKRYLSEMKRAELALGA